MTDQRENKFPEHGKGYAYLASQSFSSELNWSHEPRHRRWSCPSLMRSPLIATARDHKTNRMLVNILHKQKAYVQYDTKRVFRSSTVVTAPTSLNRKSHVNDTYRSRIVKVGPQLFSRYVACEPICAVSESTTWLHAVSYNSSSSDSMFCNGREQNTKPQMRSPYFTNWMKLQLYWTVIYPWSQPMGRTKIAATYATLRWSVMT